MRLSGLKTKLALICLLCIPLVLAGCKNKSEGQPEHVKERIAREKKQATKREAQEAERAAKEKATKKKVAKGELKEKYDESNWSEQVAEGYRVLFRSGIAVMPDAARRLAQMGMDADKAMRRVITHPRLPVKKRAFTSLMLVQMYLFRPADLIKLLEAKEMPFAQRAAIETLGMLGVETGKDAMRKMKAALEAGGDKRRKEEREMNRKGKPAAEPGHAGHGHGPGPDKEEKPDPSVLPGGPNPYGPLIEFLSKSLSREDTLGLSEEKLKVLDAIMQSHTAPQLKEAIKGVTDLSYEQGLALLIGSPVSSELSKVGAALRLIELGRDKPGQVLTYCKPGYPPMLRMAAARFIVERADRAEVETLTRMAAEDRDPMSRALQELLIKKPVLPKAPNP